MKLLRSCVLHIACGTLAMAATTRVARGTERDQLRPIVQQQCLPHWLEARNATPCVNLRLYGDGPDTVGFAVLPDRKGRAHDEATGRCDPLATGGAAEELGKVNEPKAASFTRTLLSQGRTRPRSLLGSSLFVQIDSKLGIPKPEPTL